MIELVPLPLLMSVPGTAEPGIATDCGEPGLPVTSPAPREVAMPGVDVILGTGVADGATTAGLGVKLTLGGICAQAAAVSATRKHVTNDNLIILHAPRTGAPIDRARKTSSSYWIWWTMRRYPESTEAVLAVSGEAPC
jgi:hypothetical protein